jgi:endonuclease/exonuclease/phosphatase family metal-dependent hydrolase
MTTSHPPRWNIAAVVPSLALAASLLVPPVLYAVKSPVVATKPAPIETGLKITTFNTEYWHIPEQELVNQVRTQDMDLVFFQEHLEKHGDTWGPTNRIPQLKAVLKDRYIGVNGEVVTVSKWPIVATRAFSGGQAIRTDVREPGGRIVSAYNIHLPVHLHLNLASNPIQFFHDAQTTAARRQQLLDEVIADLSANQNPTIVAGDFNTSSAMSGTAWFRRNMVDAYAAPHCPQAGDTFELGRALTWRIDYVFVSRHFVPTSYCTQAAPHMSDHKAVVATLGLAHAPGTPHPIESR